MSTIKRPTPEVIEALYELGTDAVTSTMEALGVRRTFMEGPIARVPGSKIVGPALTLRFLYSSLIALSHCAIAHCRQS